MAEIRDQNLPHHHALVIPSPFQGHINPAINLSLNLASNGFIITFVNTQFIHSQITKSQLFPNNNDEHSNIFSKARESGLDIRYITIYDGFPLDFDRNMNSLPFLEGLINDFSSHVDELVGKLMEEDDIPINCLVADTFFVWPSIIAKKYEIVHVSFFTEPALVFALYYHLDLLEQNGHFGSDENRKDVVDYIPGIKSIESSDLPSLFQNSVVHQLICKAFQDVQKPM